MADKSWGASPSAGFRVRTNDSLEDRSAQRAKAREDRARDRDAATAQRLETRSANREAETNAREQARVERREAELQAAVTDPHAAAAKRHRPSGRKDVVREQRDTRAYTTIVDAGRIRELAKRGASLAGLAGAFGISEEEVERLLHDTDSID